MENGYLRFSAEFMLRLSTTSFNDLTLIQGTEPGTFNRGTVHGHVLATAVRLNAAIAFVISNHFTVRLAVAAYSK